MYNQVYGRIICYSQPIWSIGVTIVLADSTRNVILNYNIMRIMLINIDNNAYVQLQCVR